MALKAQVDFVRGASDSLFLYPISDEAFDGKLNVWRVARLRLLTMRKLILLLALACLPLTAGRPISSWSPTRRAASTRCHARR